MDSYIEFPSPTGWLRLVGLSLEIDVLVNGPGIFSGKPQRGMYRGSAEHVVDY